MAIKPNDPRLLADCMTEDEVEELADYVGLDVSLIRGLDDKGLCDLLNCEMAELPYELFADPERSEELMEVGIAFGAGDEWASCIAELEQRDMERDMADMDDWYEDDYSEGLIDLDYIMDNPQPRAKPGLYALPSRYPTTPLPSWATTRRPKLVVNHHFEIVC